jgi:hypothetical protein
MRDFAISYQTHTLSSDPVFFIVGGPIMLAVGICIVKIFGHTCSGEDGKRESREPRENQRLALNNAAVQIVGYGFSAMGIIALLAGVTRVI